MKKSKIFIIAALMLVMGAFIIPFGASAATAAPSVTASVSGKNVTVYATDSAAAVEYIFIDGKQYDYNPDGLTVDASAFAADGATLTIYATDVYGNQSAALLLDNPAYASQSAPATPSTSSAPATSSQPSSTSSGASSGSSSALSIPLTPDGQATVIDQTTGNGKDFYTFKTPAGNVFYLVVDHTKTGDNVYFLSAVQESDLEALAQKAGNTANNTNSGSIALTPGNQPANNNTGTTSSDTSNTAAPAKSGGGNSSMMLYLVIGALAIGGGLYYFKVYKPKKAAAKPARAVPEDEDDSETDEMEFEDYPDEDEPGDEPEEPAPSRGGNGETVGDGAGPDGEDDE